MDYGEMLGDAWGYAKDCTFRDPVRWLKLMVAVLCLGLPFQGYVARIYRGGTPAPAVDGWGRLFSDGLKMFLIGLVYILPLIFSMFILFGAVILMTILSPNGEMGIIGGILGALCNLLCIILEFVAIVILPIAYIRFARSGIFSEAFNFPGIGATIGKIGWIQYLVAVVLITILVGIPVMLLFFILMACTMMVIMVSAGFPLMLSVIAILALIFIMAVPVIGTFQARYLTRVYESAGEDPW